MELGGRWRAAGSNEELRRSTTEEHFDDSSWPLLEVPGHWRSHPDLADSDGPVLYRRRFSTEGPASGARAFITFDGIFYQGDVWLDGDYLGDTEGYFFPHTFEITEALRRREDHLVAVEVSCQPQSDRRSKRNLTGVFQHWDCIDPDWNPGGIWAGVRVERTGPVRITSLKVLCREANAERATLDVEAELDSPSRLAARLNTRICRTGSDSGEPAALHQQQPVLSAGSNVVRWRVVIERPDLWWPRALGLQPLYDVEVEVRPEGHDAAEPSDRREVVTGLRQIRFRNFIATVNGERLFLKGANYGPTRRGLGDVVPGEAARDVQLAAEAGLDLLRVHAHIARPDLYEAADRTGMLLWQDLPLQWSYGQVRRQAIAQSRQAVVRLGHHPSVALWCGHNEPLPVEITPNRASGRTTARVAAAQVLPTWNKTALDRSIKRALERADGSRTVVAHSGVAPHPAWGTDSHLYYGWYHGEERELGSVLARFPVLARFVSEFGAQAVPETAGFMDPAKWPGLDWERLAGHHGLQKDIFDSRVPPADFSTFDEWRQATQRYQAQLLRSHIETLRRLKYRPTGGFCFFLLADCQPAVTWSVLDHERAPKEGYRAVAEACAPVIVTSDRPAPLYRPGDRIELDIHAVSDLRSPLLGVTAQAVVRWRSDERVWRFGGDLAADCCARIGRISMVLPRSADPGPLTVDLRLSWPTGSAINSYASRVEDLAGGR